MSSELLLEVFLYCTFLALVLLLRRFNRGVDAPHKKILFQSRKGLRQKPQLTKSKHRVDLNEAENWRLLMQPPTILRKTARNSIQKDKIIVDLRKAFENRPPRSQIDDFSPLPPPPPPPPSPVNMAPSTTQFGLDNSFVQFIETESTEVSDSDHERRRNYLKKQITDGEVMIALCGGRFQICQIYVYGIEYHYVHELGKGPTWELPPEIKDACRSWFLALPKIKQRKFFIETPPDPLYCGKNLLSLPTFAPLDVYL